MAIDYRKYPANWFTEIRPRTLARAQNRCECTGECGLHPHWRCQEKQGRKARFAKSKIVLTIAHMNRGRFGRFHEKSNPKATVKAICQRCHLRYDLDHHIEEARKTREANRIEEIRERERQGQEVLALT